jgi:RimJ/RimL family protein N-acetyltransferase
MKYWEYVLSDSEVHELIEHQLDRYEKDNVGLWAMIDKETGTMVGYVGLLWGDINDKRILKLPYMLKKTYWHKGFAIDGAKACAQHAFSEMNIDRIFLPIRPENSPSVKVAEKLSAKVADQCIIKYRNKEMLHLVYVLENKESIQ